MRRAAAASAIILAIALALSLRADDIHLKGGRRVSGKATRRPDGTWIIHLDNGHVMVTRDVVRVVPTGAGDGKDKERADTAGTLEQTLTELVARLGKGSSRAGKIVRVAGEKVYINLGTADGVKIGDEFEVVRKTTRVVDPDTGKVAFEERDVAGRLRVTNVQAGGAVCELVAGKAERKNADGKLNQVLAPATTGKRKVCLGPVRAPAGGAVSQAALQAALTAACRAGGHMELVNAAEAGCEIRASVEEAEGRCTIALSLVDRRTGKEVARAEGAHQALPSARDMGLCGAMSVELGTGLKIAPVRKALARKFRIVQEAGDALYVPRAGPRGEAAWVFADGRVVIGCRRDLSSFKQYSQMMVAWNSVAETIAGVTAALAKDNIDSRFQNSALFYTKIPDQYQRLYIASARQFAGWVLNWPDAKATWARILTSGGRWSSLTIDDSTKRVPRGMYSAHIAKMRFGDHAMSGGVGGPLILEALFASPNGRVALYDKAGKSVVTRAVTSAALSTLYLPRP